MGTAIRIASLVLIALGTLVTSTLPSSAADAKTTITYWTFLPFGGTRPREAGETRIIENFQKENPNIAVKVEVLPWNELHTKYLAAFAAGRGPDVIRVDPTQLLLHVKANSLAALDSHVKVWPAKERADFFNWDGPVINGQRMAVSIAQNVFTLLYRKDLFDELKLSPPKTWAEFVQVAKALTTKDRWGFAYPASRSGAYFHVIFAPLVWGAGGEVLDAQGRAAFNNEPGVKALTFLRDLVKVEKVAPPEVLSFNLQDVMQGFMAGKYAMVIEGANRYSSIQTSDIVKGKVGIATIPSMNGPNPAPAYSTGGWMLGVNAKSAQKTEAWKFIGHYVNYESQVVTAQVAGDFPTRKSVFNESFMKTPANAYLNEFAQILDKSSRGPLLTDRWSELFDSELMLAMHRVFAGEKPTDVLNDIIPKFNSGAK
jgi:ABC-type glycerol-3-phosphate transport system substrate-binding protein